MPWVYPLALADCSIFTVQSWSDWVFLNLSSLLPATLVGRSPTSGNPCYFAPICPDLTCYNWCPPLPFTTLANLLCLRSCISISESAPTNAFCLFFGWNISGWTCRDPVGLTTLSPCQPCRENNFESFTVDHGLRPQFSNSVNCPLEACSCSFFTGSVDYGSLTESEDWRIQLFWFALCSLHH